MLQLREREIFKTLKNLRKFNFVVIGGYAANAYTLPRFSIDCDIVVNKRSRLMEKSLQEQGYRVMVGREDTPYGGEFLKYEKIIEKDFKVSMDILVKEILDRQTDVTFEADWVFKNSSLRLLKGKTMTAELKLRIIDIDALLVMKFISCRNADIRDVFMLMPLAKDKEWIKREVSDRYEFKDRYLKIKRKITSDKFKDDLQGVYGYIDMGVFEKHKKAVLNL